MHTALTKQQQPGDYWMTRGVHFARLKGDTSRMSRVIDDLSGWKDTTPFYNHRLFAPTDTIGTSTRQIEWIVMIFLRILVVMSLLEHGNYLLGKG